MYNFHFIKLVVDTRAFIIETISYSSYMIFHNVQNRIFIMKANRKCLLSFCTFLSLQWNIISRKFPMLYVRTSESSFNYLQFSFCHQNLTLPILFFDLYTTTSKGTIGLCHANSLKTGLLSNVQITSLSQITTPPVMQEIEYLSHTMEKIY